MRHFNRRLRILVTGGAGILGSHLIEGFIRFMALPGTEDGGPGYPGSINLGNPGEFTIRQLAVEYFDRLLSDQPAA